MSEPKQVGTMRCPMGAIVSMADGKATILDEEGRCKGAGPVFEVKGAEKHTIYIKCDVCCPNPDSPMIAMNAAIWRGFVA